MEKSSRRIMLLCILSLILGAILGTFFESLKQQKEEVAMEQKVVTVFKEKPVFVRDTIRETQVVKVPVKEYIPLNPKIEKDQFHEATKVMSDSVQVIIPITQKEYCDSDYRAWVSGYNPSLDSIWFRRSTITPTKVVTPKLGLSVGVGASFGARIEPCLFVGVTYTIKSF